ncbi:hypothetical protein ANN_15159 [Periplaneta americana]|uniref:DNA binding HTH domain-containing protein n=1 Tax=Periplaneta americana TaxID=6978 RepID=A0ABQ8SFW8_PERAM|nr:hypothetical protein ANN_15159 [Periplaneta americana]
MTTSSPLCAFCGPQITLSITSTKTLPPHSLYLAMEQLRSTRRRGQVIHSRERKIIKNIIECCDEEARNKRLIAPLRQATSRAAKYAGISNANVMRIRKMASERPDDIETTPGKKS